MAKPAVNPLVYEILQALREDRYADAVQLTDSLDEEVGTRLAVLQMAATANALHDNDPELPLSVVAQAMADDALGVTAGDVDPDDELERALAVPVTGTEVGLWMVDMIESVVGNGLMPTEESRLIGQRLAELGEPERIYEAFAQAAAALFEGVKQQMDLLQKDAQESGRRALLGVRWMYDSKGKQLRSPFSPSSEG